MSVSKIRIAAPNALHNPDVLTENTPGYPSLRFRNGSDPDPTKPWWIPGTSGEIILDLRNHESIYHAWIHKHNASSTVEWLLQQNNANSEWDAPIQEVSFHPRLYAAGGGTSVLVEPNTRPVHAEFPIKTPQDWLRLQLDDDDNTDGRLEFGYIHLSNTWEIKNVDYNWSDEYEDPSVIFSSEQGQTYTRPRKKRRVLSARVTLGDLDSRTVMRKLAHLGTGHCTFLEMTPFFLDGTFDPTSTPEWLYGRFRAIKELREDIHHGYEFTPASEYSRTTFEFEFEEIEGEELPLTVEYTNHAEFVKLPSRTDVMLVVLAPREPNLAEGATPLVWDSVSGDMWSTTYPIGSDENWYVFGIYHKNVLLTRADDVADCAATEGSWFHDLDAERVAYVHLPGGLDPNDELVEIAPIFAYASECPATQKWAPILDLSSVLDVVAPRVFFELRLSQNGLSSIRSGLETAHYGVSTPSLQGIEIINGKRLPTDLVGIMDAWQSRFRWRDTPSYLWHGDGGAILDIDEHWHIDTFRVLSAAVDRQNLSVNYNSSSSVLIKKIPQDVWSDDDEVALKWKPLLLGGPVEGMPTRRLNRRDYGALGCEIWTSSGLSVAIGGKVVGSGDYTIITNVSETIIRFNEGPKIPRGERQLESEVGAEEGEGREEGDGPVITLRGIASRDIDGVLHGGAQLAGAGLRYMLNVWAGVPLSELPATSFSTLDSTYAIPIKVYVPGDNQITIRDVLDTWSRSLFAWIRRTNGIWETYRYNPSSLRTTTARIYQDEIISMRRVTDLSRPAYDRVRTHYAQDITLETFKFVWDWHPTARLLFEVCETLDVEPTHLYRIADARRLRDLYILTRCIPERPIEIEATGEIFTAAEGDIVELSSTRPLDDEPWNPKKFIVMDLDKQALGAVGLVSATLIEPVTEDESAAAGVTLGTPVSYSANDVDEVSGDYTVTVGATKLLVAAVHVMNPAGTVASDGATYDGSPMTELGHSSSPASYAVRVTLYEIDSPATGTNTVVVSFSSSVKTAIITIVEVFNCTDALNLAFANAGAEDPVISKTIASASGDLVLGIFGTVKAPPDGQSAMGPGQTRIWSHRKPYGDSYVSESAGKSIGMTKPGAANVTMKVSQDPNTGAKILGVVTLRP